MAVMVTSNDATEGPGGLAAAVVLGRIAIPGCAEHVRAARAFVAGVLRELAPPDDPVGHNAVLLASELVTNAIRHSRSGESGGSVTLATLQDADGIRVEVTDDGSADDSPVVKDDAYTCDGHGLFLVEAVADEWGYRREDDDGTTVWFRLGLAGG